jgi:cysteinyl-tRNA synthetase
MAQRDIYLYNTASRTKEKFVPMHDQVGMYCCGPTVYDYAHVGNMRTYIWEDALARTFRALGHRFRHVMNITDVGHLTSDADTGEDKMEKGARREGKSAWEIAKYYTEVFLGDLKALNCQVPDVLCRATEHIREMIDLIVALDRKGYTYTTSDGLYFDTSKFPRYVEFARLDPESLDAGARVDMK